MQQAYPFVTILLLSILLLTVLSQEECSLVNVGVSRATLGGLTGSLVVLGDVNRLLVLSTEFTCTSPPRSQDIVESRPAWSGGTLVAAEVSARQVVSAGAGSAVVSGPGGLLVVRGISSNNTCVPLLQSRRYFFILELVSECDHVYTAKVLPGLGAVVPEDLMIEDVGDQIYPTEASSTVSYHNTTAAQGGRPNVDSTAPAEKGQDVLLAEISVGDQASLDTVRTWAQDFLQAPWPELESGSNIRDDRVVLKLVSGGGSGQLGAIYGGLTISLAGVVLFISWNFWRHHQMNRAGQEVIGGARAQMARSMVGDGSGGSSPRPRWLQWLYRREGGDGPPVAPGVAAAGDAVGNNTAAVPQAPAA